MGLEKCASAACSFVAVELAQENADFQTTVAEQRASQQILTKALDVLKAPSLLGTGLRTFRGWASARA